METPSGIEVSLGQRWREKHKYGRDVIVVGFTFGEDIKVHIQGYSRVTKAKLSHFNGKSGGYEFVCEAPQCLL